MRQFVRRLLHLFRCRRHDDDLLSEIAFHREMKQRELERQGLAPDEAAWAAQRALGNDLAARQQARDVWVWPGLQELTQDLRFAARLLVRDRGFAAAAVLVLGLGIGVNNMMVTLIYGHTLRRLPIQDPERVLYVSSYDDRAPDRPLSHPEFEDLQHATAFVAFTAYFNAPVTVGDEGRAPERFEGVYVTANAFEVIGRAPLLGRMFTREEDQPGARAVALLGSGPWRSRYDGDAGILGRTILVNGAPAVVIGVVPDRSGFPSTAEVWLPLSHMPDQARQTRDVRNLRVFGRVRDGVDVSDARAEVESIFERTSREHPDTSNRFRARVVPVSQRFLGRPTEPAWLAFIAVGFLVLIVSCANVANLLLARAVSRTREIAIRVSLGASPQRIVAQLLIESIVLAGLGGVIGLGVSVAGVRLFRMGIPDSILPYWLNYEMDARVFAALVAVSFGTVLLFGLVPALQAARADVNRALKDGGRASAGTATSRWSTAFLTAEFSLSVVLLAYGVVSVRDATPPLTSDKAINTPELLAASVTLPTEKYRTPEQRADFYQRLEERFRQVPGVAAVSIASTIPLRGAPERQLELAGRTPKAADAAPAVRVVSVGPGYFATLGVPLQRGDDFSKQDLQLQSAIVSQRFAEVFFPNEEAVAQRIRLTTPNAPSSEARWVTIIGVAQDIRYRPIADPEPTVYLPFGSAPPMTAALLVRSRGEPEAMATSLRAAAVAVDPHLPLYRVMTMQEVIHEAEWNRRISVRFVRTLTILAVGLLIVGLYAVTAHAVGQRTQEIGVRMALGAKPEHVRRLAGC